MTPQVFWLGNKNECDKIRLAAKVLNLIKQAAYCITLQELYQYAKKVCETTEKGKKLAEQ